MAAARAVLQSPDLALALSQAAGVAAARSLAASSASHGPGLRAALPALLLAQPPEVYVLGGEHWQPGGQRVILADAERFDPASGCWDVLPPMPTARRDCAAAACAGLVYVMGGESDDGVLATVDVFEPAAGRWAAGPAMLAARSGGAAAAAEGALFALGGRGPGESQLRASRPGALPYRTLDVVERLDPATGQWEELPPMPVRREYFAAVARAGRLYAIGGCNDRTFWAMLLSGTAMPGLGCDVLDLVSNRWETLAFRAPMPTALRRAHHSAALAVASGCGGAAVYVLGGYADRLRKVDFAERMDLDAGRWEDLPRMQAARAKCAAAISAGCVYAIGGHDGPRYWASGERLDVATGTWSSLPPMSTPRAGCAAAATRR